jgi:hypothetical protein
MYSEVNTLQRTAQAEFPRNFGSRRRYHIRLLWAHLARPDHPILTAHHFGRTAKSLNDASAVERRDDVVLFERTGFFYGRRPKYQAA